MADSFCVTVFPEKIKSLRRTLEMAPASWRIDNLWTT
jgi:hypothetical protein